MNFVKSGISRRRFMRLLGAAGTTAAALPIISRSQLAQSKKHEGDVDVVIYGGTPAGLSAAAEITRAGKRALIIEPTSSIGGMITGGIAITDTSTPELVGGIARDFFMEVARRERASMPQDVPVMRFRGKTIQWDKPRVWDLEPKVAAQVFKQWLRTQKTTVLLNKNVASVKKAGARIEGITLNDGTYITGKIFIDASYEGDLLARAGVSYTYGRESSDQYGERMAGIRAPHFRRNYTVQEYETPTREYMHHGQFGAEIPARDSAGKLLWGVEPGPLGAIGSGDKRVQSYCYRLIATQREDLKLPWPQPKSYVVSHYDVLLRYVQAHPNITFTRLLHLGPIPNGKWDLNASGPFSTDFINGNVGYPDAPYHIRRQMIQAHIDYQQGFLWFLSHDPRLPKQLRDEVNSWGPCRDEWVESDNWPVQLYIREARRMIGQYVVTERDILEEKTKQDSVGMGSFVLDSHWVRRFEIESGAVRVEGDLDESINLANSPYEIPYRALIPKQEQCENLIVPVCISATHVAICTIRMEPVYMILGHSAGLAAIMALNAGSPVQQIDVKALVERLAEQQQILHREQRTPVPNV